jgi:hypothetical protein
MIHQCKGLIAENENENIAGGEGDGLPLREPLTRNVSAELYPPSNENPTELSPPDAYKPLPEFSSIQRLQTAGPFGVQMLDDRSRFLDG